MGDDVMHLAGDPGPFGREVEQRLLVAFAFSTLAALSRGGQGRAPVAHGDPREQGGCRSPGQQQERLQPAAGPLPSEDGEHRAEFQRQRASQLIRAGECSNIAYSAMSSATSATSRVSVTHWISAIAAKNPNVA